MAVEIASLGGDPPPQSLNDLVGVPSNLTKCPVGKESYSYDSATGQVTCPRPGHGHY